MMGRMLAIFRLLKILKELRVYYQYRISVYDESINSPIWTRLRLRKDWLRRIYTVVNLPPEVTMSREFPVDARPAYVFEELKPVNDYLTKLNLQEVLTPVLKPIPETNGDSYLVIYYFFFRYLSWIWIFRFITEVTLITLCVLNWNAIITYLGIV
jgi:hypothetical protein